MCLSVCLCVCVCVSVSVYYEAAGGKGLNYDYEIIHVFQNQFILIEPLFSLLIMLMNALSIYLVDKVAVISAQIKVALY